MEVTQPVRRRVDTARLWMNAARPSTAPAAQILAISGSLLAGNALFSYETAFWFVFSTLYHVWGFMDNNLRDYEYDLNDPNKKSHALVRGDISFSQVQKVASGLLLGLVVLALLPIVKYPVALQAFVGAISAALVYNRVCKVTVWSPLPIAVCWTSLYAFAYMGSGGTFSIPFLLFYMYVFLQILYQIGVSGYYKDVMTDKVNLLRKMGAHLEDRAFKAPRIVHWFALLLKATGLCVGIVGIFVISPDIIVFLPFAAFGLIAWERVLSQMTLRNWSNAKVTRLLSLIEISTLYAGVTMLQGVLGWTNVVFLWVFPLVEFMILNRVVWGRGRLLGPVS